MFELPVPTQEFVFPRRLFCPALFSHFTVFSVLKPGVQSASGLEKLGTLISAALVLCSF